MVSIEDHFKQREEELKRLNNRLDLNGGKQLTRPHENSELVASLSQALERVREYEEHLADRDSRLADIQREVEKIQSEKKLMEKTSEKFESENRVREFRLHKAREEISDLKKRITELNGADKSMDSQIRELRAENSELKKIICENMLPLIGKKNKLIEYLMRMGRLRQVEEELLDAVDGMCQNTTNM